MSCHNATKFFSSAVSAYAYIGAHDLFTIEEGRMVMFSDTFVEHPEYKTDQISNDIALVKLPKKISYSGMSCHVYLKIMTSN